MEIRNIDTGTTAGRRSIRPNSCGRTAAATETAVTGGSVLVGKKGKMQLHLGRKGRGNEIGRA